MRGIGEGERGFFHRNSRAGFESDVYLMSGVITIGNMNDVGCRRLYPVARITICKPNIKAKVSKILSGEF